MHANYERADRLSGEVIGAAVEVHRTLGAGLLESVYEKCLIRELEGNEEKRSVVQTFLSPTT